ncbi:malto-oligosyltrehalose synthase [Actinosynnema pretiosum subsp. pretiosum]|uniref:Malto-oligosyltrehalose synthase n=2 Tax=Actinosynnema TaxID=40566 RepID=C6W888_ACTMD|nr:malto-oligosyltrehalose synthase [Actinosynnema mirum DSM 43827]AXX32528.1 Malto-oligosyltrehalose synthase [Actinosynnema pretiosum subsp. pretiosum]QUF03565.1 malto-oligosyltrehalose synthase [Actinosynnema pretiosum subsp. pretiosum]
MTAPDRATATPATAPATTAGAARPQPPSSTYRLQFTPGFTFADAEAVLDYLGSLGAGALYASPLLEAVPGSTHGYDVTDPARARADFGGEQGRASLAKAVRGAGLGFVVDIVPNHMAVDSTPVNAWWTDVMERGQGSPYARYFDIDWSDGTLLLPFAGDEESEEEHEHYRLAFWRRGNAELNYRRFFDITTLAAVRVEDPEVFEATHGEVLRWVAEGDVTGLRVDHPDGLADPGGYARDLAARSGAWVVVEKILGPDESLPVSWPVAGTTGYDALREVCGLFVDPAGEGPFTDLAVELGVPTDFAAVEHECRALVASTILSAEVRRIAALLEPSLPEGVDVEQAREAVAAVMAAFPVYRSYLPEGEQDWATAVRRAGGPAAEALDAAVRADPTGELATRIQQTSGMVVAKGTEDTAFYRFTRFVALNEVGGAPDRFGVTPEEFHRRAAARESGSPDTMTALSTHDTKRSEDVRARLAVLAEVPDEFAAAVRRWSAAHPIDEPSLNALAWQSLVGAWPVTADRMRAYLEKAAKESKVRTTWVDHDEEFEAAVDAWPAAVLGSETAGEVAAFVDGIVDAGWSNALGQKLVQLTAPGVPDVYQGTELWDLSLVDPDNRRPVDYAPRRALLERIDSGWLPDVDDSGAAKLLVTSRALRLRGQRPELFRGYRPVPAAGPASAHALAFERTGLITVATRLPVGLARAGGWGGTVLPLPPGEWTDVLTGRVVTGSAPALADLLDRYPVALLVRGDR